MPLSEIVKVNRDGLITIADLGASKTLVVSREPGDFTFDAPEETVNLFLDRGVMAADGVPGGVPSLRLGDDQPCTLGWSAYQRDMGS